MEQQTIIPTRPPAAAPPPPRAGALGIISIVLIAVVIVACAAFIRDPMLSRSAMIAGTCLVLWLTEAAPLYATTLLLWVGIVVFLGPLDAQAFSLPRVMSSAMANPVMALFFGGFALSAAGARHGIDAYVAGWMVRASRGRRRRLLLTVMVGTAVLSMWMSNIAAAAMMFATLRPLFGSGVENDDERGISDAASFRRALLLGIAMAANFGGMATPVGTGPNLIAIGAVADRYHITFLQWMGFATPLAALMLAAAFALIVRLHHVAGPIADSATSDGKMTIVPARLTTRGWTVVVIFGLAVAAWLLEPVHGVPAGVSALAVAGALFATRLLDRRDLMHLEWDTLLLVAGGLTLGEMFDASGLAGAMAAAVDWNALPLPALLLAFVLACASISAIASNTAAAAMLIQIALSILPLPSVAVLVALGASMGVPFVISTPPNSMAYGQGGLHTRDFFVPGIILMLVGCALVALTGPWVLRTLGIP
jgi:sodium-dependent dicarboxylate transporter 2/3/5